MTARTRANPGRRSFAASLLALGLAAGLPTAQAAPREVTIAVGTAINTLDPHNSASIGTDLSVASHIYDALVLRGPDLKLHPDIATAWRMTDPTTWRFTLRDGVRFPDGERLDAAAVKWNLDRVRDPKTGARIRAWFEAVSEVNVISPTELEIRTAKPFPALPDQLSMFFLLAPEWTRAHKPAVEAMGSGPYELAESVAGDHITLRTRPGYWGPPSAFQAVRFRVIPDNGARVAALLAGEVDLATNIPPADIARIRASGRADAGAIDSIRTLLLKFNMEQAPLGTTPALRQALNLAVDRQGIIDALWSGYGHVSNCQLPTPAYDGYNPALHAPAYDPDAARNLLRQAGIAPGSLTLDLEVPLGVNLLAQDVAQAVAAQIEDIGIHVRLQESEFGAWQARYLRAHQLAPMTYMGLAWPTLDAGGLLGLFETGNIYAYWSDPVFTAALNEAQAEPDTAKRQALYARATARMCEQAPVLFLFAQPATYGVSHRIAWQARGDDWVRAMDMQEKQK